MPRAGAECEQLRRQPALDIGGLGRAVVGRVAGALPASGGIVVPLRRREDHAAGARHVGLHVADADVADDVDVAKDLRIRSAEAQHQIRRLALLADVDDLGLREATVDVGGAIAQRIPALRGVDVAIGQSFGVQTVVAQRVAAEKYQRAVREDAAVVVAVETRRFPDACGIALEGAVGQPRADCRRRRPDTASGSSYRRSTPRRCSSRRARSAPSCRSSSEPSGRDRRSARRPSTN